MTPIRAVSSTSTGRCITSSGSCCVAVEMALHFAALGAPRHCGGRRRRLFAFRKSPCGASQGGVHEARARRPAVRRTAAERASRRAMSGELVDGVDADRPNKYLRYARRRDVVSLVAVLAPPGHPDRVFSDYPAGTTNCGARARRPSRRCSARPIRRSTRSSRTRAGSCAPASSGA